MSSLSLPSPRPAAVVARLHNTGSPTKVNLPWIPVGMDQKSACRLAIRVPAYEETGRNESHVARELTWVRDRDTICWMDLRADLDVEIKHGADQTSVVRFWDKNDGVYKEIDSDGKLLEAFQMYWSTKRLPIIVEVQGLPPCDAESSAITAVEVEAELQPQPPLCTQQSSTSVQLVEEVAVIESADASKVVVQALGNNDSAGPSDPAVNKDPWGEHDEVEYVGVDDERGNYADLFSDNESDSDYIPDSDEEDRDDLLVDDETGCHVKVHVTNLENPKIDVGITFEDGETFKRAIRYYAILNEIEIKAPYSEETRYRGYCKAKKCMWRIHASQLQDGKTWMIKKIPYKHYCRSTAKVENNFMANQFWVQDRVVQWLRDDPTIGAANLLKKLEEKYLIKLSYWIVWNDRQLALDEILGKWDDSFQYAFDFKAEIESKSPGSIVEIDYEQVGSKMRFSKMFVALKPCIDGFLNGCRPYMGIDSTVLTGRWKGQLASAVAILMLSSAKS